jgi:hypothetical protein
MLLVFVCPYFTVLYTVQICMLYFRFPLQIQVAFIQAWPFVWPLALGYFVHISTVRCLRITCVSGAAVRVTIVFYRTVKPRDHAHAHRPCLKKTIIVFYM